MSRTTIDLVEGIIEVDSSISLTPFIAAANTIVTQCCTDLDADYTTGELQQIETWLSAHFYTNRDMRASRERAGTVEATYQSKVDLGFKTSHYGQHAMLLYYHVGLANLDKKIQNGGGKPASLGTYLGKDREEKISES